MKRKASANPCFPKAPPAIPQRLMELLKKNNGRELCFVMEKTITVSDILMQQNRLLIPAPNVDFDIIPMLSDDERREANLFEPRQNKKHRIDADNNAEDDGGKKKKKAKEKGREHGGLDVVVFNKAGWKFFMALVHWDSKATVIKGGQEWKMFLDFTPSFRVGDKLEMWAFRYWDDYFGRDQLCFFLWTKNNWEIGSTSGCCS